MSMGWDALVVFSLTLINGPWDSHSMVLPGANRTILLEGKFGYSVQLVLGKGVRPGSHNPIGVPLQFTVKAPFEASSHGIMAVVQSIRLHKEEKGGCRDYLQFSGTHVAPSPHICGELEGGDSLEGLQGPRTFFARAGDLKMLALVGGEEDDLGAVVVFTAYMECPSRDTGVKKLRSCSISDEGGVSRSRHFSCIPSSLFCDSKINCALKGEPFGLDEQGCHLPYFYWAYITIGLLVLSLVLFFLIRWLGSSCRGSTSIHHHHHRYTEEEDSGSGDAAALAALEMDANAAMASF